MKRAPHIFYRMVASLMLLVLAVVAPVSIVAAGNAFIVVIDPGHGGKDPGCVGASAKEKDINLKVALALGKRIKDKYGDKVKVVYTRSNDSFVTLQARADKANNSHGDLFISIHVNSVDADSPGRATAKGASVFTLGLDKSSNNLKVAMRENSVIELEADHKRRYRGFDSQSSESYIMFELSQNLHRIQSINFARLAQKYLVNHAGRADKSVHQAGFWVLWATAMPSVLVELDYICNPAQEKFLASSEGQDKCAEALFKAFCDYYSRNN